MLAYLWKNHSTSWAVRFGWNLKCLCAAYPLCSVVPSKTRRAEQAFPFPWSTNGIALLRQLLSGQGLLHLPACLKACLISDQSEKGFCYWLWLIVLGIGECGLFWGLHWRAGVAEPVVGSVWEVPGNGYGTVPVPCNVTASCHHLTPNQGLRWKVMDPGSKSPSWTPSQHLWLPKAWCHVQSEQ